LHLVVILRAARIHSINPESTRFDLVQSPIQITHANDGQVLERAGGGFGDRFGQAGRTPLRRLAAPEEVAQAVLAVGTSLTFMTGAILPVDGGALAGRPPSR